MYFPGKGAPLYKGEGGVSTSLAPHVGLFPHGGCAARGELAALVGPIWPTRVAALSFSFSLFISFPLMGL